MLIGSAKRRGTLSVTASGLLAVVAASCSSGASSTTTTTGLAQATFGTEQLWNTVGYHNSYSSSVFITPYWAAFSSSNGGRSWKLRMPANVSPRRGITLAFTPAQDEAVGFFAYGAQQNSVVFVFGPGHVSAPVFLPGSLEAVRQAVGLGGGRLYALGSSGAGVSLLTSSVTQVKWHTVATGSSGGVSALGFGGSGLKGMALLGARISGGVVTGAYATVDGGADWSKVRISAPAGERLVDAYVPPGFATNSYDIALTLQGSTGFVTEVAAPGKTYASPLEPNRPVVGADSQGDVFSVSGLLGQVPQLNVFDAATLSWHTPITMNGVTGAVMSVGFSDLHDGVVVVSASGKLVTYYTSDGGSVWHKGGSIVAVPSAG